MRSLSVLLSALLAWGWEASPTRVYMVHAATWFEEVGDAAVISADGRWAAIGTSDRLRMVDLVAGVADAARLRGPLDAVENVVFDADSQPIRLGTLNGVRAWYRGTLALDDIPTDAVPAWSRDGAQLAYFRTSEPEGGVRAGPMGKIRRLDVPGRLAALAWAPDGRSLGVLTRSADFSSALGVVSLEGAGGHRRVADALDAAWYPGRIAFTPDGREIIVPLVGEGPAVPARRHDPAADRDLDLWAIDVTSGSRRVVAATTGDDFAPVAAAGALFWTSGDIRPSVAIMPIDGGDARDLVTPGEMPRWRPDGRQIAFTIGGWRLRDMALPLDTSLIDVDADGAPASSPRPFITGFHEDFTPAWSPDGRWLVYHSHRSPEPVSAYAAPGSTDDLWLRPVGGTAGDERRLTSFGYESGSADWSPDGRRLAFVSQERGATAGISKAFVIDIDPRTGALIGTRALQLPPEILSAQTVSWSPNGASLAVEAREGLRRHAIWVVQLSTGAARRVTSHEAVTFGGVDWTPDGGQLVYGALADGAMQIFRVAAEGGTPRRLSRGEGTFFLPQVSPDGRWVASTRVRHERTIWRQAF